jgi:hypothetical protein
MRPRTFSSLPLLLLMLGLSGRAGAVECRLDETPDQCWERAKASDLRAEEVNELKAKPTGVQAGDTSVKSNTTDFLPLLAMSGLLGDVQEDEAAGTYTFDLNFLIPHLSKDKNSKLKAIVNSNPTISDGIKEQIPSADRDEVVDKLEEELGDLADYTLSFTYSWNNRTHGRGFENYADRFEALTGEVTESIQSGLTAQAKRDAEDEFLAAVQGVSIDEGTTFEDIRSQFAQTDDFNRFVRKFEIAADRAADALQERQQKFTAAGLGSFAQLIDNQPQLTFSAEKRFRDPQVGSDEMSYKVNYEIGRRNLNRALGSSCQQSLKANAAPGLRAGCLTTYTNYVDAQGDELDNGEKISFSAEWVDVDGETFDLPQHALTGLTLESATKLVISAGFSRRFFTEDGDDPLRLDFVGSYEDVSDDPMRQDRGVATLTVTRKFRGIEIPLGIVYANHSEFLGEVDEQFGAHFGIKFNLGGKSEENSTEEQ